MNAITNGTFEAGTTGWVALTGGSIAQSNAQAHQGAYSCAVSPLASGQGIQLVQTTLPPIRKGISYRVSCYVKGTAGVVITTLWREIGGNIRATGNLALTGGWDYIEVAAVSDGSSTATPKACRVQVYANQATTFYLDDVVFEEEPHPLLAEMGGIL